MMLEANGLSDDNLSKKSRHILLLGASVGQAWGLVDWPKRMDRGDVVLEMISVYQFDKSAVLDEVLMRPKRKFHFTRTYLKSLLKPAPRKPDIIILKECSGYFPGNQEEYESLIKQWVNECKKAGIKPVVTTVVPITDELAKKVPDRLRGVLAYNDWIRKYAREIGIGLLDLEVPLRISEENRFLREDLTSGDGSHLNKKAYDILDAYLYNNFFELFGE